MPVILYDPYNWYIAKDGVYVNPNSWDWYEFQQFLERAFQETGMWIHPQQYDYWNEWQGINKEDVKKVVIAENMDNVVLRAFDGFSNLTEINILSTTAWIDNYSSEFPSLPNLEAINVAEGNWNLSSGDGILFNKQKTTLIRYPQAKAGTSYAVPASVTNIEFNAFNGCGNLISVNIPKSVTYIGSYAFDDCSNLVSIDVANDNSNYSSENGVLFNKQKTKLIRYPQAKKDESYTVPVSVTSIGDRAFRDCVNLTSASIPNSVTSIGSYVFSGCKSLSSINIPNLVTSIENGAFKDCSRLTSISIPVSVKDIYSYAFSGCTGLDTIKVSWKEPLSIFSYTFYNVSTSAVVLSVPKGTKTAYENANIWKEFKIVEEGEIEKAAQTITFEALPEKTYGDASFTLNATNNSGLPIIYTSSNPDVASIQGNVVTIHNAGVTNITASSEENISYYAAGPVQQELIVNKAWLSVTTYDKEIFYGDFIGDIEYAFDGFVNNDFLPLWCSVSWWDYYTEAGSYEIYPQIECVTELQVNYNIDYRQGILTIKRAPLTITATDASRKIGEDNPSFSMQFDGFKNNEDQSVLDGLPNIYSVADRNSPAGFYDITLAGGYDDNYEYHFVTGLLEVTPSISVPDDNIIVIPTDTTALIAWQPNENGMGYKLIVYTDNNRTKAFCTLEFNAIGQLTAIEFRFGAKSNTESELATIVEGFAITVRNLNSNTTYYYTMETIDTDDNIIDVKEGTFKTSNVSTNIFDTESLVVNVYTSDKNIMVENAQDQLIRIFDISGRIIAQRMANTSVEQFQLSHNGIYIVRVGEKSYKILLQ